MRDSTKIKMEALITKRELMIAENAFYAFDSQPPKYGEPDFEILRSDFLSLLEEDGVRGKPEKQKNFLE